MRRAVWLLSLPVAVAASLYVGLLLLAGAFALFRTAGGWIGLDTRGDELGVVALVVLGTLVGGMVGLVYIHIRAIAFVLSDPGDGTRVTRRTEPALIALVEEVRAAMIGAGVAVPRVRVRLTTELYAGIGHARRTLVLGIPLLRLLDRELVRAIIAHELGHLAAAGNCYHRSAHRVEETATRLYYFAAVTGKEVAPGFARGAAELVARLYMRARERPTVEQAHACELVADARAARVCPTADVARAIHAFAVLERLWYVRRQGHGAHPSAALAWIERTLDAGALPADLRAWIDAALDAPAKTHPAVGARCEALGHHRATVEAALARPRDPLPLRSRLALDGRRLQVER